MIVETFFLVEEKRSMRTQTFQDLCIGRYLTGFRLLWIGESKVISGIIGKGRHGGDRRIPGNY
jgi:hypothetical protein